MVLLCYSDPCHYTPQENYLNILIVTIDTQLFYWRLEVRVTVTCSNWIIFSIYLLNDGDTRKEANYYEVC